MKKIIFPRSLFKLTLFLALVYFPVFLHLDFMPINVWDEARNAVNSFEMKENGNYLVTHHKGSPDMWNTKPPLLFWMQSFFYSVMGPSELAVRLPSALAALLTALLLLFLSKRYLNEFWFGFIAMMILVTSEGYISMHGTRTGDFDALLGLFTFSYCVCFFLFLQEEKKIFRNLFFIALTLAALTKGIQGFFFLPALFIFLVVERKTALLWKREILIGGCLTLLTVSLYYFGREIMNPGYLQAVWENELGGRYMQAIEYHGEPFDFFYKNFMSHRFSQWYWLVPLGIILGLLNRNDKVKKLTIFSGICSGIYFLIISGSSTKVQWYDIPLFPFLSILAAVSIHTIFTLLSNLTEVNKILARNIFPYLFLFIIFLHPYSKIIETVYFPKSICEDQHIGICYYLQDKMRSESPPEKLGICYFSYNTHILFYMQILNTKGWTLQFEDFRLLKKGDKVLASQPDVRLCIERIYFYDVRDTEFPYVKEYLITGKKKKGLEIMLDLQLK